MSAKPTSKMQLPDEEYEAQFFGFLPSSLMEGIVRLIEDRMSDAVDEVEENLAKVPESLLSREQLQKGVAKLRSTTSQQTTKILDNLQQHMTGELLRLPSHLLLPCDLEQSQPTTRQDVEHIERDLDRLHKQLSSELYMQAALKSEMQQARQVLQRQEQVLQMMSNNLTVAPGSGSSTKDNLRFLQDNTDQQSQCLQRMQQSAAAVARVAQQEGIDLSSVRLHSQALEDVLME